MNDLIINVDALEEANQPFEADLRREFLDGVLRAPPATEFHAAGASRLSGRVTRMGREVLVQARATVPLKGQCKRCLKPVTLDESVEIVRNYVPEDRLRADVQKVEGEDAEATFDPNLVDEEAYGGREIDVGPAVREQVLLSIPASPVCREDCKGLCAMCGRDLNEGECGCDRTVMDPRWSALKGIQLEKKEK